VGHRSARIADYPQMYATYWPAEKRLARLHAMGYDAYHLVGELFNSRENAIEEIEEIVGATGRLFLTPDGRVHRKLAWAQFQRGQIVPLPDIDEFQGLFDDSDLDSFDSELMRWQDNLPNN